MESSWLPLLRMVYIDHITLLAEPAMRGLETPSWYCEEMEDPWSSYNSRSNNKKQQEAVSHRLQYFVKNGGKKGKKI